MISIHDLPSQAAVIPVYKKSSCGKSELSQEDFLYTELTRQNLHAAPLIGIRGSGIAVRPTGFSDIFNKQPAGQAQQIYRTPRAQHQPAEFNGRQIKRFQQNSGWRPGVFRNPKNPGKTHNHRRNPQPACHIVRPVWQAKASARHPFAGYFIFLSLPEMHLSIPHKNAFIYALF
jgi:hypothetical protein